MEEVVVTGMGCVSSLGNDPDTLWANLLAGKSGVSNIEKMDTTAYDVHFASEVKEFDDSMYFSARDQKRYSRNIRYAVYSALHAVQNSGLDLEKVDKSRAGVIVASGMGGMDIYYDGSAALATKGPRRVSPFFIPMSITNMATGEISIRLGFMGPNFVTTSACASSNHALIAAADQIRLGRADVMVAGGTEEAVTPVSLAGFANMHALSRRNDDPQKASRPFDKNRDGFVIGEGAAVMVLESRSHAEKRGAKILATIAGVGLSADAHHITAPREDGAGVKLAIENALRDAKLEPQQVGYINTHGTSTPLGDVAECKAICEIYKGDVKNLKINSSKSMIGHMLGSASAIEGIISIQSLLDQKVHGTINVEEQDPAIQLDVCANGSVEHSFDYAMSNSFGFGGHNSVVIFGKNK
ncbi:3-oxoacyl-[acyl-carrier-protein] synthase II [Fibrobacter intestinalis]|uniref:3-oxoacyl-[acyl-carrier-protein] synthase 2 n=1 Tax=Fibrobacter intestinalis TaxID=28122 RepID=A0A1M6TP03_9BACT|nr:MULTISPECIES: beta-ketoacyl-ACP synthase II [Fibrobacter]MDD7300247.1 beta-ketoacyl-ACP synthase II [Fibrobacter intestinalis]PBC68336.1 3-oxoacyl-[acyl-carrier-protein] synthase II [Fibrobacter sp. UWS1]PBC73635.1 3-oxoacyl-[acyl-carrier-protein] synthase II [Fibrobacter sp. NR9]SHK58528.1 3-oxoacyl-[acyl-carrier-protein] synthase II [Fibrobacter intestinalis]SKA00948.1 3-oxoacyl-[acyl-carrier-protein] synthase II [Fibrobacter intestinalis]